MFDIVVIGGGPAGLAAAYSAYKKGIKNILLIERDAVLGGILNQCIHNGFGLHHFKEELTGPEYANKFIKMLSSTNVQVKTDTMVMHITDDKQIHYMNSKEGYQIIHAKSIILAMGCRERTRGAIAIPGDRCSGIFTAGAAQRYVNMDGLMVGKRVVILGSGDIGLIMARRMTLEGAKVLACVELMPYSNGLTRNIVQCLDDFGIPLYLSHTVSNVCGKDRLEKIVISKVDENRQIIPNTDIEFDCDTLLLSVGLIPENELSSNAGIEIDKRTNGLVVSENMETSVDGIFACGNVLHVHDLVDFVTAESELAGENAASYILNNQNKSDSYINVFNGDGVLYTVPQKINKNASDTNIFFRVKKVYKKAKINVTCNGEIIATFNRAHMAPGEMEKITLKEIPQNSIDIHIYSMED